jgi:nicotinate-nucleotide pyrophosphorylase (carboxylating)
VSEEAPEPAPAPRAAEPGRTLDPPRPAVLDAVRRALDEDLLPLGDLTAGLVDDDRRATLHLVARGDGVIAGSACAAEAFARVDARVEVRWSRVDGDRVEPGAVVATVGGPLRSILTAERTALNFLGHLSGVATLTDRFVRAVQAVDPRVRVLDTRKTTPGLRALEKAAVRAGGGHNHRANLSDAVLVKDNHLVGVSIAEAVARARSWWPGRMVEVECDRADQVRHACEAGVTSVLLDNMTPADAACCVALARAIDPRVLVEVSGGITLETAPEYAAAGVDLLSVGALTHSAPVLDLGLDLLGPEPVPHRGSSGGGPDRLEPEPAPDRARTGPEGRGA